MFITTAVVKAKPLHIPESEESLELICTSIYAELNDSFCGTTELLDSAPINRSGMFIELPRGVPREHL